MDHRCPWIDNRVGELNQKYFVRFLFYAGLALAAWLGPGGRSPAGMAAEGDIANNRIQTAYCIILLLESLLFGAFVAIVFYDQVMSIIMDKTPLEQLRNRGLKEMNCEGAAPPETQTGAAARGVRARLCALLALPLELQPHPGCGPRVQPPTQPLCLSSPGTAGGCWKPANGRFAPGCGATMELHHLRAWQCEPSALPPPPPRVNLPPPKPGHPPGSTELA